MLPERPSKTDTVSIDPRPIRTQILAETTTFHRGQVLAPLAMTLTTLAINIIRGFDSIWAGVFWTFVSIVAGVVAYYLIAVIRAPFIVIARHHHKLMELSNRLLDLETRSLHPAPSVIPGLPLLGKADLGCINGAVYDWTGDALESVIIVTRDDSNKERSWTTASAMDGRFDVDVPPGSFTVTATLEGYRKESRLVVVKKGTGEWIDFNLKRAPEI